jgi:hypothetical protein
MREPAVVDERPRSTVHSPTLQLLSWIDERERTYAETMDAWRSSCPRLTVWEDAVADDLVEVVRRRGRSGSIVVLTARGRETLG